MSALQALDGRLSALPRKVAAPLRELLAVGHIDGETLSTILDAGDLSGTQSKLLGFAVGCLYLQSKNVPVKDVIHMARVQGRRIRLDWSGRRWQDEHDRLARAETLARLSGESVKYDLAAVAACLPSRWKGYLIRCSRRLGMEGLRQRHCVASYHQRIRAGHCAIATVFIQRRRWTVELCRTQSEAKPLVVLQMRSRFNERPSSEVIQTIHQELGIEWNECISVIADGPQPRLYLPNLRRVLPLLRANGVGSVIVTFDGCGDSGSIQEVCYNDTQIDGTALQVEVEMWIQNLQAGRWIPLHVVETVSLNVAIERLTDDYLSEADVNWYDGSGGYGQLVIDVAEGSVSLEINVRHEDSTTEFCQALDIGTGSLLAI